MKNLIRRNWGTILAFVILFLTYWAIGDWSGVAWMVALPFGWRFPGFCNKDIPHDEWVCNIRHEGACAGLTQCIQTDVDNCRHVCEVGIYTIKDKKREDSSDPQWTTVIREQKCSTPSCNVMVPYVEGDQGPVVDVHYCQDCADHFQADLEKENM